MYKGSGIFELTKNVLPRKKIFGIPRRNWIECIIFTGVVEAVKAPALYVYVNGIYMENNIEDQNFLEAIGYRIIGVR